MSRAPVKDVVVELYREGALAIAAISEQLPADAWELPACGTWTATETVRHVLGVVRWYDHWLDRAIAGDTSPPFLADQMVAENDRALATLADLSAADAVETFLAESMRYVDRVSDEWARPYAFPYGTVTAGLHCGVAATEWHIHADDLSRLGPAHHFPTRPDQLFLAASYCFAAAEGGIRGRMIRTMAPLAARRDPWDTLRRRSGRID